MKKAKLKFKSNQADEVSTFMAENSVQLLVTWTAEDGFFNTNIFSIVCFPDTLEDKFVAKMNKFIVTA